MRSPGAEAIRRIYKPTLHGLLLLPVVFLVWNFSAGRLGANPVEALTHQTGEWALRVLLITLAITPMARLTRSGWLIQFRRMVGLYVFFYAALHFMIYLIFDLSLDFSFLAEDIIERPYITVGFAALLILLALTITSPIKIRQRMGKSWQTLHYGIYAAGILAVVHFLWITRVDDSEPIIYGAILTLLLAYRLIRKLPKWLRAREVSSKTLTG